MQGGAGVWGGQSRHEDVHSQREHLDVTTSMSLTMLGCFICLRILISRVTVGGSWQSGWSKSFLMATLERSALSKPLNTRLWVVGREEWGEETAWVRRK